MQIFCQSSIFKLLKNTQITLVVKLRKFLGRTRKILSCASGRRVFKLRSSFLLSNYCTSFLGWGQWGREAKRLWMKEISRKKSHQVVVQKVAKNQEKFGCFSKIPFELPEVYFSKSPKTCKIYQSMALSVQSGSQNRYFFTNPLWVTRSILL